MTKWYGSFQNRVMENHDFTDEIKVGTGMTEYLYTDREPYEVIAVKDQKHVTVRRMDHRCVGGAYSNDWELISNENMPVYEMTKRGKYWYFTVEISADILDEIENCTDANEKFELSLFLAHNEVDPAVLRERGKITKYHRANVSFGRAEYHYDYEF